MTVVIYLSLPETAMTFLPWCRKEAESNISTLLKSCWLEPWRTKYVIHRFQSHSMSFLSMYYKQWNYVNIHYYIKMIGIERRAHNDSTAISSRAKIYTKAYSFTVRGGIECGQCLCVYSMKTKSSCRSKENLELEKNN